MKIKHLVLGLLMGAALGFGTACSDDDDVKVDAAVKKDSGAVKKDGGAVIKDSGVVKKDSGAVIKDSGAVMADGSKG